MKAKGDKETIPYFAVNDSFDIAYRNSSTSSPVKPHIHNAMELYFTLTDLPDVLLDDTVSSVEKGTLILIPPYCVHQLFHQELTVYERYILSVNLDWLSNVFASHSELMRSISTSTQPRILPLTEQNQIELRDKLESFLQNSKHMMVNTYAEFFCLLDYIDTLVSDFNLSNQQVQLTITQSQETVNRVITYINEHLTEPLSLQEIADHFFMNKDYLARLFKKHIHSTIGHYIDMQRVNMAQQLLSKGYTVSQVQEKMGFSSYAYFHRFFTKMTGVSPSVYRKSKV